MTMDSRKREVLVVFLAVALVLFLPAVMLYISFESSLTGAAVGLEIENNSKDIVKTFNESLSLGIGLNGSIEEVESSFEVLPIVDDNSSTEDNVVANQTVPLPSVNLTLPDDEAIINGTGEEIGDFPEILLPADESTNESFNQSYQNGTAFLQQEFNILALPVISSLIVNTTNMATNDTDVNLTANVTSSDADGDSIKHIYNWLVNDSSYPDNGRSITILNMPFERVNGTNTNNAYDYSGYNQSGRIADEASNATWSGTGGYDGKGTYIFDGINDYIDIPSDIPQLSGISAFTIVVWVYKEADGPFSNSGGIFTRGSTGQRTPWLAFNQDAQGPALYFETDLGAQDCALSSNGTMSANAWNHIAARWNGTWCELFLNGVFNGSEVTVGTILADTDGVGPFIGRADTFEEWEGRIDDLMIFNRSLLTEQIKTLYNNSTHLISHTETTSGQNWTVDVTPNDGSDDGARVRSNSVLILDDTCSTLTADKTLTNAVSSTGTCFTVGASGITLDCDGYQITYGTGGQGYGINNTGNYNDVTIRDCVIKKGASGLTDNNVAINVSAGANGTIIINNTIVTGGITLNHGIAVTEYSNQTRIENNTIYTNGTSTSNFGIYVASSFALNAVGNTIVTNGTGNDYGIYLFSGSNHSTVRNNTISVQGHLSNTFGVYIREVSTNNSFSGNTIYTGGGNDNYGITADSNSGRNIIENNSIYTNGTSNNYGIYILTSLSEQIYGNTIVTNGTGSNFGIYLFSGSNHSTIRNNTISTRGDSPTNYGIFFSSLSTNNSVSENTIYTWGTTDNYGFHADSNSDRNIIENNSIYTNGTSINNHGIYILTSLSDQIYGNTIYTNGTSSNYGIYLRSGSNHSTVRNNTISTRGDSDNNHGIDVFSLSSNNSVSENTIYTWGTGANYGVIANSSSDRNIIENNSIYTNGTLSENHGIYIHTSLSDQISCNTIVTNGTSSNYVIYLRSQNHSTVRNNTISTRGDSDSNYGIYIFNLSSNNSVSKNTVYTWGTESNYGVGVNLNSDKNIIENNSIYTNGTIATNYGMYIFTSLSEQIYGNTIVTNGTRHNYGIYLTSGSNHSLIINNTISTRGSSDSNYGLAVGDISSNNSAFENTIYTWGTAGSNGVIFASSNKNSIKNNSIYTNGTITHNNGIEIRSSFFQQIYGNTIVTNGTSNNYGIYVLNGSNHSFIDSNKITARGSQGDNYGLFLNEYHNSNNTFVNNNITITPSIDFVIKDNTPFEINNSLIYNNTFGEIHWVNNRSLGFVSNLTINVTNSLGLGLNRNLFIGDNITALNTSAFFPLRINSSANITLKNLSITVDRIETISSFTNDSNSVRSQNQVCTAPVCSILSNAGSIIKFNVSYFSSYAADSTPAVSEPPAEESGSSDSGESQPAPAPAPPSVEPPSQLSSEPTIEVLPVIEPVVAVAPSELSTVKATVTISNPTSRTLRLKPEIKKLEEPLENELNIRTLLADNPQYSTCGSDIDNNIETLKLLEQENVQPIYKEKYSEIFNQDGILLRKVSDGFYIANSMSGIVYSGAYVCANLLRSQLLNNEEIVIGPGEKVEKELLIRRGLSADPKIVTVAFTEVGREILVKQLKFDQKLITGTAVDSELPGDIFDIYFLIINEESRPNGKDLYLLEVTLNKKLSKGLQKFVRWLYDPEVVFSELFGPYEIDPGKNFLFAQQMRYDSNLYSGEYLVRMKVYLKGKVISEDEFEITLS